MTILTAGLNLNYPVRRQEVDVSLRRDFLRYSHYSDQDSEQDEVRGNISLNFLDRVSGKITGGYSKSLEPRENYQTLDKNERINKTRGISLGYHFPSGLSIHTSLRQEEVDFSLPKLNSREYTNKVYSGVMAYSPSPDTKFDIQYERNVFDYNTPQPIAGMLVDNDSTGDTVKIGFNRSLSPKTLLSFSGGYLQRRHEEFDKRDFAGEIGKAEVNYGMTEKLTFSVTAEKRLYEEIFLDQVYSVNESLGLGAVYRPTAKVETFLSINTTRKSFKGDANIITTTFPVRKDRSQELKMGIAWTPVSRFSIDMLYRYTTRDSNFDSYDYKDNVFEGGFSYSM